MVGAHQNLNDSRVLMVCHPSVSKWYDQPICQIWNVYLHPLL